MPPEEPQLLIAIDFALDNGNLIGREERIEPEVGQSLFASWYANAQPEGYSPVCGGVVYVRDSGIRRTEISDMRPVEAEGRFIWRDTSRPGGVMFAIVLPSGHSLSHPHPLPQEAKNFQNRLAVHWMPASEGRSFEVTWSLKEIDSEDVNAEVQRINKIVFNSRRPDAAPEYDVALSYASEDGEYVENVAAELKQKGITVFDYRDEDEASASWGTSLSQRLTDIYSKRARYTVVFISAHYAKKRWTTHEMQSAQASAFIENREYILPARFDDTELPGLLPEVAYVSLTKVSPIMLADMIKKKVESISI